MRKTPCRKSQATISAPGCPQFGLAAGIPHHGRAAPHDTDRAVPSGLHVRQRHNPDETSQVEAVGSGLEDDVIGHFFSAEELVQSGRIGALKDEVRSARVLSTFLGIR